MKTLKYISISLLVLFISACEDYLDKKDPNSSLLTEDDILRSREKILSVAYRLYDTQAWFFETRATYGRPTSRVVAEPGKNYGNISELSGEIIFTRAFDTSPFFRPGYWKEMVKAGFGNPDFYSSWVDCWEAIYVANYLLSVIDRVSESVLTEKDILQIKGEAFLFRGWAYHEISKRWGPMPYYREKLTASSEFNKVRPSMLEQINDIVLDLDSAIYYLPEISYFLTLDERRDGETSPNMGRHGKVSAMAIKSRALTTAASPNYTENNQRDIGLWERAAEAAWDLIELSNQNPGRVGLHSGDYNEMFHTLPGTIEGVWPRYYPPQIPNIYRLSWMWLNIEGYSGFSPSQELVDRFETSDGYPINDDRSTVGYNEQDPYNNRDPRFEYDILHHGSEWAKTADGDTIDMRTDPLGEDRQNPTGNGFGNSKTGYLVKKLVPKKWNTQSYGEPKYCNAPYIRMAEIYLNYAEAVNEAYQNPGATASGAGLTAIEAVNLVRERAGHVPLPTDFTGDYESFQERVRNEFIVELCFEYHMWFDLIRWRIAEKELHNKNFNGMRIIDDLSQPTGVRYERVEIPLERAFEQKNYRYPIREEDLQLYDKLEQNPGW